MHFNEFYTDWIAPPIYSSLSCPLDSHNFACKNIPAICVIINGENSVLRAINIENGMLVWYADTLLNRISQTAQWTT